MQARKARKVKPVIKELLQAIEGSGMSVSAWFEVMDDLAINNMITQTELSKGMQILQTHSSGRRKKQPVLTADQVRVQTPRPKYQRVGRRGLLPGPKVGISMKILVFQTLAYVSAQAIAVGSSAHVCSFQLP